MVWYGMVWYGMAWHGMVWYGMVWYGIVWQRGAQLWAHLVSVAVTLVPVARGSLPVRVPVVQVGRRLPVLL